MPSLWRSIGSKKLYRMFCWRVRKYESYAQCINGVSSKSSSEWWDLRYCRLSNLCRMFIIASQLLRKIAQLYEGLKLSTREGYVFQCFSLYQAAFSRFVTGGTSKMFNKFGGKKILRAWDLKRLMGRKLIPASAIIAIISLKALTPCYITCNFLCTWMDVDNSNPGVLRPAVVRI